MDHRPTSSWPQPTPQPGRCASLNGHPRLSLVWVHLGHQPFHLGLIAVSQRDNLIVIVAVPVRAIMMIAIGNIRTERRLFRRRDAGNLRVNDSCAGFSKVRFGTGENISVDNPCPQERCFMTRKRPGDDGGSWVETLTNHKLVGLVDYCNDFLYPWADDHAISGDRLRSSIERFSCRFASKIVCSREGHNVNCGCCSAILYTYREGPNWLFVVESPFTAALQESNKSSLNGYQRFTIESIRFVKSNELKDSNYCINNGGKSRNAGSDSHSLVSYMRVGPRHSPFLPYALCVVEDRRLVRQHLLFGLLVSFFACSITCSCPNCGLIAV
jgi:hypothetical protein